MFGIFEKEVLVTRVTEEAIVTNNDWDDISVENGILVKKVYDLANEDDDRPIEYINSF